MSKQPRRKASKKKSNFTFIGLGVLVVLSFAFFIYQLYSPSDSSVSTSNSQAAVTNGGVQEITMDVSAAGYNPDKIVVKKGVPVKIITNSTADAGCVRGLMIPDFGINAALDIGKDSVQFTPDKTGTFQYTCQMQMATGILEVVA